MKIIGLRIEKYIDKEVSGHNCDIEYLQKKMLAALRVPKAFLGFDEATGDGKNLRPVWIFKGKSHAGKSFLASKLNDLEVYETDSNENLPTSITASIVVLGNKYNHSIDDIKLKLFGEVEVQIVEFQ